MVKRQPFNYLSVCSGIEAFSVAVHALDFKPVAFAEIDDFPNKVLAYRFPGVRNLGDFTVADTKTLGRIDWLVGGTPCQSFSVAGLRKGLADDRGNLTLEYVRIAHELAAANGLRGLLWENVPGCLSDKTNAFGCFLGALVGHDGPLVTPDGGRWTDAGMVAGPRARLAWRILDSQHFGVPQRRRRVFVVADFGNGPDPAAVLFEPRGQKRRAAASREAEQEVAATISASTGGVSQKDGHEHGQRFIVAPTLRAGGNSTGGHRPPGSDVDTAESLVVTHSLSAEGADASEDGTGRGTPLVVYSGNAEGGNADMPSLSPSNTGKTINNQTPLVSVFDPNGGDVVVTEPMVLMERGRDGGQNLEYREDGIANAILTPNGGRGGMGVGAIVTPIDMRNASRHDDATGAGTPGTGVGNEGDPSTAMTTGAVPAVAFNPKASGKQTSLGMGDVTGALTLKREPAIAGPQVRRLTPEECEKLQGYPVGWTRIPGLSGWRAVAADEDVEWLRSHGHDVRVSKKTGKARVNDPDGPRYKALGNSFTTEPVNWIMCRVQASMRGLPMPDWQPMRLWAQPGWQMPKK